MHFYPWDARHGFRHRVACEDKLWARVQDDYHHYLKAHGLRKLGRQEYGDYIERRGAADTDVPWEHSWDRFTGREARRFIEGYRGDGPFALMVGFPGPHDPYDPARDFPHKLRRQATCPRRFRHRTATPAGSGLPTPGRGPTWAWTSRAGPSRG